MMQRTHITTGLAWILALASVTLVACGPVAPGGPVMVTERVPVSTTAPGAPTSVARPPNIFGLDVSQGARSDGPGYAKDLGARWIRVDSTVTGSTSDVAKDRMWLDAGFDLVITMKNRQPGNVARTYGTTSQWTRAGFPYVDQATWKTSITQLVAPLKPYLDQGRQIIIQSENEIGDASVASTGMYFRGTTDDYLALEGALYDAIKAVDTRFKVSLTSLASQNVEALIDPSNPRHAYQVSRVTKLLTEARYDAIDLHFYGCTSQITSGALWVNAQLKPGTTWISTENAGPTPQCPSVFSDWSTDLPRFRTEQAAEVRPRLQACADGGASVCMWFILFNLDDEVSDFNHLGLLSRSTPTVTYRAYEAFKAFTLG